MATSGEDAYILRKDRPPGTEFLRRPVRLTDIVTSRKSNCIAANRRSLTYVPIPAYEPGRGRQAHHRTRDTRHRPLGADCGLVCVSRREELCLFHRELPSPSWIDDRGQSGRAAPKDDRKGPNQPRRSGSGRRLVASGARGHSVAILLRKGLMQLVGEVLKLARDVAF